MVSTTAPLLVSKILVTLGLLVLTILFTFLPWIIHSRVKRASSWMSIFTCLAAGVIIGAFFFHIVPHIIPHSHEDDHVHMSTMSLNNVSGNNVQTDQTAKNESSIPFYSAETSPALPATIPPDSSLKEPVIKASNPADPQRKPHVHGPGCKHGHHKKHKQSPNLNSSDLVKTTNSSRLPDLLNCGASSGNDTSTIAAALNNPPFTIQKLEQKRVLSDEQNEEEDESNGYQYPWGAFAAGLSFFLLLGVDRLFLSHNHCPKSAAAAAASNLKNIEDPILEHTQNDLVYPLVTADEEIGLKPTLLEGSEYAMNDHGSCHSSDVVGACHMDGINEGTSKSQAFLFVLVLSIHSFLEGLVMDSINTDSKLVTFSLSLGLHKLLESFALGINVFRANFKLRVSVSLNLFYSVLTPLGIVCSMTIKSTNPIMEQILNGLAAGSFLFVACMEMITPEFHKTDQTTPYKFIAALLGFGLMAGIAIIPNAHSHY